jgi:hypothetical protein
MKAKGRSQVLLGILILSSCLSSISFRLFNYGFGKSVFAGVKVDRRILLHAKSRKKQQPKLAPTPQPPIESEEDNEEIISFDSPPSSFEDNTLSSDLFSHFDAEEETPPQTTDSSAAQHSPSKLVEGINEYEGSTAPRKTQFTSTPRWYVASISFRFSFIQFFI